MGITLLCKSDAPARSCFWHNVGWIHSGNECNPLAVMKQCLLFNTFFSKYLTFYKNENVSTQNIDYSFLQSGNCKVQYHLGSQKNRINTVFKDLGCNVSFDYSNNVDKKKVNQETLFVLHPKHNSVSKELQNRIKETW